MNIQDELEVTKRNSIQGMTVLELLIILAALALIVLITVPGSTFLLEKYRLKQTYNNLQIGLELAGSEAQARSSTVVVCPSSNQHTCRADGDWNLGWLVFSDGNGDGEAQEIELIRAFEAPSPKIRIFASGAVATRAALNLSGLITENEARTGQFLICYDGSDAQPRVVNVNEDGWVTLATDSEKACKGA